MSKNSLQLQQLNSKIARFAGLKQEYTPPVGWTKAIRTALGMSLQQLGKKLNMTKQGVMDLERREQEGSITLKSLRATAGALDMDLVYALVPRDGSLDALIERRATELATTIVLRTAVTMQLEGQANTPERLEAAIRERATLLRATSPKLLWD